tara:strand:- start:805 stop:1119 length:315 start_codon:yes stop_codon:yes gene_type:complete
MNINEAARKLGQIKTPKKSQSSRENLVKARKSSAYGISSGRKPICGCGKPMVPYTMQIIPDRERPIFIDESSVRGWICVFGKCKFRPTNNNKAKWESKKSLEPL